MSGLIQKDILYFFKRGKYLAALCCIAVFLGFNMEGSFVVSYLSSMISIYTVYTIAFDEPNYPFIMTLPANRRSYVNAKYLFCQASGLITTVFASVIYIVIIAARGSFVSAAAIFEEIIPCILVYNLIQAFTIPVLLKFGAQKSGIVMAIFFGIGMIIILGSKKIAGPDNTALSEIAQKLDSASTASVSLLIIAVCIVLTAVSMLISHKIMKNKEF